jgi:hypothetical protein
LTPAGFRFLHDVFMLEHNLFFENRFEQHSLRRRFVRVSPFLLTESVNPLLLAMMGLDSFRPK